jgi:hypothetical protein
MELLKTMIMNLLLGLGFHMINISTCQIMHSVFVSWHIPLNHHISRAIVRQMILDTVISPVHRWTV